MPLRGLALVVLFILNHYELAWGRPVTSEEIAWSIFPLASATQVEATLTALIAVAYVKPLRDGWHCLVDPDDI